MREREHSLLERNKISSADRASDALRGRAATVRRLIGTLTRRNGAPPSDAELAGWLACSVETIRRAKALPQQPRVGRPDRIATRHDTLKGVVVLSRFMPGKPSRDNRDL